MANGKNSMNGGKTFAIAALAAVAGLGGGYLLGWSTPRPTPKQPTYEEGFAAAKQKLEESGMIFNEPEVVMAMNGQVMEVKASSFILKPDFQAVNPLVGAPETREVLVTAETVITMEVPKSADVFAKETAAFQAALKEAGEHEEGSKPFPMAPLATEMKKIALKDLKVGSTVRVTALENVKMAASFTASEVYVFGGVFGGGPVPAMMVPPDQRTSAPPPDLNQPEESDRPVSAPSPNVPANPPGTESPRTNYVPPPSDVPEPEHPEL